MNNLLAATASVAALALCSAAQAATIDFESGFDGVNATGHPELSLYSALGGFIGVGSYGDQGDGQALAVGGDSDGDYLKGVFNDGTHTSLSLSFGNDDGNFTNAGDLAFLRLFLGSDLVGQVSMVLNRDDIMNQTISYSGAAFNNFTFAYTNVDGLPFTGGGNAQTGLVEIVDNITYDAGPGGVVPEPATWALMIGGFGLAGAALRRRKAVAA